MTLPAREGEPKSQGEAVETLVFDDGGLAFLNAVKTRGRERAQEGDPISYFTALHETIGRLVESGYTVGATPYIDGICGMSLTMRQYGGNPVLAMMIESIVEPSPEGDLAYANVPL